MTADPYDLARFTSAQEGVIETALAELRARRKRSHWMWFVFPQLRGLGSSPTAQFYGVASLDEARAYLAHPVLGRRLEDCVEAVLAIRDRTSHEIFGSPDDMKFRSSMTLCQIAADGREPMFDAALERFCDGRPDARTIELLGDRTAR